MRFPKNQKIEKIKKQIEKTKIMRKKWKNIHHKKTWKFDAKMDPKTIKKPLKNHLKIKVRKKRSKIDKQWRMWRKKVKKNICGSPTSIVFARLGVPDWDKQDRLCWCNHTRLRAEGPANIYIYIMNVCTYKQLSIPERQKYKHFSSLSTFQSSYRYPRLLYEVFWLKCDWA